MGATLCVVSSIVEMRFVAQCLTGYVTHAMLHIAERSHNCRDSDMDGKRILLLQLLPRVIARFDRGHAHD